LSLSLSFRHQNPVCISPVPHTYHTPHQCHSSWFDHPNNTWWAVQTMRPLTAQHFHAPKIFPEHAVYTAPIPFPTFLYFWGGGCNCIPCVSQLLLSCDTYGRQPTGDHH
jgi:hypothetical protein